MIYFDDDKTNNKQTTNTYIFQNNNDVLKNKISNIESKISVLDNKISSLENKIKSDIADIIDKILSLDNKISSIGNSSKTHLYNYTGTTQTMVIDENTNIIYITGIAGGGAGGIGFIKDTYYCSGAGGGAGACIINKPLLVSPKTIIKINVGRGGSQMDQLDGQPTIIEIICPDQKTEYIVINGGCTMQDIIDKNINMDNILNKISGGKGGISQLSSIFNGANGQDGYISLPSQQLSVGGVGGSSIMSVGKSEGDTNNIIGKNGQYGSGGCGSNPLYNIPINQLVSGNGGNGVVLIESAFIQPK